jgi:hypothetical protein
MGAHQWADEELTLFYQHYHNTTKEWDKVRKHGSTRLAAAVLARLYKQLIRS